MIALIAAAQLENNKNSAAGHNSSAQKHFPLKQIKFEIDIILGFFANTYSSYWFGKVKVAYSRDPLTVKLKLIFFKL